MNGDGIPENVDTHAQHARPHDDIRNQIPISEENTPPPPAPQCDPNLSSEVVLMDDIVDALAQGQSVIDFARDHNMQVSTLLQDMLMTPGVATACKLALHQYADTLDVKAANELREGLAGKLKTAEGRVLLQLAKVMERQAQAKRDQAAELQAWLVEVRQYQPRGSWLTNRRAKWAENL